MSSVEVIKRRLAQLESHLQQENPVLLSTVQSFRELDKAAYRLGLLDEGESFSTKIPWWPLISVLGTFSAGKSTFVNHYVGAKIQRSGNQAVDDRFTVLCYSHEQTPHALPGVALDSDPRFPFYGMSEQIEAVAPGEGRRIDAYLQLKTCPSEALRGKILIDSPGFDSDSQRASTLRITDHIIDLSDLVLVLFDARHPEPGAMRDTLDHLVSKTIHRPDSGKFLYILNQIDTAAREDNPEEVVAAWQRALGERGLTTGRFYATYNPDAAVPIEDPERRRRFETKRDTDLAEIHGRMRAVEIERAYRIVGALEKTAVDIRDQAVPALIRFLEQWKRRTLWGDLLAYGLLFGGLGGVAAQTGHLQGIQLATVEGWMANPTLFWGGVGAVVAVIFAIHFGMRNLAARSLEKRVVKEGLELGIRGDLLRAFRRNTRPWRSIFGKVPAGWRRSTRKMVETVLEDTDKYVQTLNDRFTNPSGENMLDVQHAGKVAPPPAAGEAA